MSNASSQDQYRTIVELAHRWCEVAIDRHVEKETVHLGSPDGAVIKAAKADLNLVDEGWDGTWYVNGLRQIQRGHPEYDRPYIARGLGSDWGVLEQLARTSPQFRRAFNETDQAQASAPWRIDAGKIASKVFKEGAELQRITAQRSLFKMQGGFQGFRHEVLWSLFHAGFSIHVRVDHPDGTIRKMSWRRPSTVHRWILNEDETELVGVEFKSSKGAYYVVPVEHLFIVSIGKLGLDFESLAPARVSAPWIKAKQMAAQLWAGGLQKYGNLVVWIENSENDVSENERYVNLWDKFDAYEFPVITGKKGQKANLLAPGTQLADYQSFLRYCDEQILLPVSSEGALLGLNQLGAYNLGELKDSQQTRVAIHIAQLIADAVNGDAHTPYTGLIKHTIDCAYGDGEPSAIADDYPCLVVPIGDEVPLELIIEAAREGLVQKSKEVVEATHERLKLPPPKWEEA